MYSKVPLAILFLLCFGSFVNGQSIQKYAVMDFSGGLVNSALNAAMKDNQAVILDNYMITDLGYLKRRPGVELHYTDAYSGGWLNYLIPQYNPTSKWLFSIRQKTSEFKDDTVGAALGVLSYCWSGNSTCSLSVFEGFYNNRRIADRYASNMSYFNSGGRTGIVSSKSEMVMLDGLIAFPARPHALGQPRVAVIDGGGNLTGYYTYKYCYIDTTANDTSNLSPPSWKAWPNNGKVYIYKLTPPIDTTTQDMIAIYRSSSGSAYKHLVTFPTNKGDSLEYLDNNWSTFDTTDYLWGQHGDCWEIGIGSMCNTWNDQSMPPPGGCNVSQAIKGVSTTGIFTDMPYDSIYCPALSYVFILRDSSGRASYASPVVCFQRPDTVYQIDTTGILFENLQSELDSNIVAMEIWRKLEGDAYPYNLTTDSILGKWFYIWTKTGVPSSFEDWRSLASACDAAHLRCANRIVPESLCYDDSTIKFQPSDAVIHGARCFAIGDPHYKNRVYYSAFGYPTTFPLDKFLEIPSRSGDWLVRILSLNDQLIFLRQNSVLSLSGLTFYQYSIRELIGGLGITAPRSLVHTNQGVYFVSNTQVYSLAQTKYPVSLPVEKSFDSLESVKKSIFGFAVKDQIWFSANGKTYVFTESPVQHWTSYSLGINAAVEWNYDPDALEYEPNSYILALDNDSLWRWNYNDTATTDGGDSIFAVYQSKYFFEDLNREKVCYIDIIGSGQCDSLKFTFYDNYGDTLVGSGEAVDSVTDSVNFSSRDRVRVKVDHIFTTFSVKIEDFGTGDYVLRGYEIGYIPWDEGRSR